MTALTRRSFFLGVAGACVAKGAVAEAVSGELELEALLAEVARARSSLRTMEGPFAQERTIGLLKSKVRSQGTLTLVRPDRLRWELDAPDDITYWLTPAGLAYKSRAGQGSFRGTTARLAAALDDVRTLLGGDLSELRARYDLRVTARDAREASFVAIPRSSDAGVPLLQRLAFTLGPDLVRPLRASLVEGPRDKTEITFGALARDVAVDPKRMTPP